MLIELIARNRNLSTKTIQSTEAGLYFGKSAIEIGLADEITIFSEFKEKISINENRSFIMTEQTIEEQPNDLIEQGKRIGYKKCRSEVLELIRLCNLSRMPEKLEEFIEQNVSVQEARETLMSTLAERTAKAEIFSALPQDSSENLMMKAAKARCNI